MQQDRRREPVDLGSLDARITGFILRLLKEDSGCTGMGNFEYPEYENGIKDWTSLLLTLACKRCGALVLDDKAHDEFHKYLEEKK